HPVRVGVIGHPAPFEAVHRLGRPGGEGPGIHPFVPNADIELAPGRPPSRLDLAAKLQAEAEVGVDKLELRQSIPPWKAGLPQESSRPYGIEGEAETVRMAGDARRQEAAVRRL